MKFVCTFHIVYKVLYTASTLFVKLERNSIKVWKIHWKLWFRTISHAFKHLNRMIPLYWRSKEADNTVMCQCMCVPRFKQIVQRQAVANIYIRLFHTNCKKWSVSYHNDCFMGFYIRQNQKKNGEYFQCYCKTGKRWTLFIYTMHTAFHHEISVLPDLNQSYQWITLILILMIIWIFFLLLFYHLKWINNERKKKQKLGTFRLFGTIK